MWFTDWGSGDIGKVYSKPAPGEAVAPQPGSTVEYHVPLSGTGLATLTGAEVEKWGQKDDPSEGMAIFAPDEPQGWPAADYKHASITYLDEVGRAVNTASPSGAISTAEYNGTNDVVRSLSADDRVAALKEGCESKEKCKSAEVSKLLDTESTYEEKGSEPGTELLSTLGPQHTVKLPNGTEVEARSHTVYSYDEGAPSEGGPYHLVTKTTRGAQYSGKEEDLRTTTTSYSGQEDLGWKLREPTTVTTDPGGLDLTHTTTYEAATGEVKETTMPAAVGQISGGYALPASSVPYAIAAGPDKNLWFVDSETSKIGKITTSGTITEYALPAESTPVGIAAGPDGNLWFTDSHTAKIGKITTSGTITEYALPSGSDPHGIIEGPDKNLWFADLGSSKIGKITTSGTITEYALPEKSEPWGITAGPEKEDLWFTEYDTSKIGKITTSGTITEYALPKNSNPYEGIAAGPDGNVWFTEWHTGKIGKITTSGTITEYTLPSGSGPAGMTAGPEGNLWFTDWDSSKIGKITTSGTITEYALPEASKPWGITTGSDGNMWFTDWGSSRIEKVNLVGASAHDTETIYYSSAANSKYPTCGTHPEWANLPCQTQPAEQPGTSGLPNLAVTKYSAYNMFDEPEKSTETVGTATRTASATYDAAGRPLTTEQTSTEGKALPKVTDKYSETTGQLAEQSTETETIASKYNTLGQLTSYTDADGSTTTYEHEGEGSYKGAKELDGRLRHVSDGKGTRVYSYEETTGALKELVDTQGTNVLTFTAAYDIEGNMTSEGYPNAMTATYMRNTAGEATGIEYVKNTDCATKCPETWFTDSITPSIHGQTLEQVSSLSNENYAYDESGRLIQVQETPTGEGCTTRVYGYEADTNRTSLETAKPNSKGECTTEDATRESHTYDTADRLTDSGVKYNEFGDITKLPAGDAGGYELSNSFYVDGQLEGQTQNGQSNTYELDPEHRTHETIAGTTATITHYDGPGDTPSWTTEPVSGHWSRYVEGISGLAAIETSTTDPELQLTDLEGNVVAKASASPTTTKLLSTERSTEYGVPTTTKPAKYGWLGSDLRATELPSGVVAMGARSYVPQIGRFLQTDPMPGGSANAYAYTYGDPLNSSDPSGEYTAEFDGAGGEVAAGVGAALIAERKAAEEAAARVVAEKEAEEAAYWTHLMEPKGSELPEPPEPVGPPVYVVNEGEEGCSGTNACAAIFGGLLGKIEHGFKEIGTVAVNGAEAVVRGAKYLGETEARGAERVYEFAAQHVSLHASTQDVACAVTGLALTALPFAVSNPFTLAFAGVTAGVATVACAFTTIH
jgi:RHS repeat-associated protein